ncbi:hypothetical protein A3D76_06975 [Candidatus Roizmanbacteria bacterium RIFCSPHIGHO2_02_FULL_37_9b]|nr:MAG: hypothetical protein A3D76_06975 [Candidatus Roizmanbacteria bacterium RIFCSPHIGHO2_02_FULL_37_9b]
MKKNYLSGFSLPELLIVLTIMGILFSLTGINLLGAYGKNTLSTTISTLQADLKQQQLKAMVGDTEGQPSPNDYGIYFPAAGLTYILFQGNSFSETNPTNFSVNLNDDLQFTSIFVKDSQIIYAKGSGEFSNYENNLDYVTLRNINTDETKTIRFNQFGTVINIY